MLLRSIPRYTAAAISIPLAWVFDSPCGAILLTKESDDSPQDMIAHAAADLLQGLSRSDYEDHYRDDSLSQSREGAAEKTAREHETSYASRFGRVGRGQGLADALAEYRKYHNSDAIVSKLEDLAGNCGVHMKTEWLKDKDSDGELFSVRLGDPKADKTVMLAANEHARELLTAEVALRFVQMACDKEVGKSLLQAAETSAAELLQKVNFVILPVVNKKGREVVESNKNICQRMTTKDEGDTDLNRNMEVDWGQGEKQAWGKKPFSAYQSRIMRDLAKDVQPVSYIDLHTGARSLMTSWGYKRNATSDFKDQAKMLEEIQKKHCEDCKIGPNSIIIDYGNPGEIIDHMYSTQGIKYTSLWELYEGPPSTCLTEFTPKDSDYEQHVNNWAQSLYTLGNYVNEHVDKEERSKPDVLPFDASMLATNVGRSSGLLEEDSVHHVSAASHSNSAVWTERHPFT